MFLMPQGDHYLWYCDWCDSRNLTLWTKVEKNTLVCSACQKTFPAYPESAPLTAQSKVRQHHYQLL